MRAFQVLYSIKLGHQKAMVRMDQEAVRDNIRRSKILEGLETIGVGFEADGNPLLDVARNFCCSCLEGTIPKRNRIIGPSV